MPKITKHIGEGFGKGELYLLLLGIKADLAEIKAKYETHRHSVAGASGVGTAPSTEATTAGVTASTINLTVK